MAATYPSRKRARIGEEYFERLFFQSPSKFVMNLTDKSLENKFILHGIAASEVQELVITSDDELSFKFADLSLLQSLPVLVRSKVWSLKLRFGIRKEDYHSAVNALKLLKEHIGIVIHVYDLTSLSVAAEAGLKEIYLNNLTTFYFPFFDGYTPFYLTQGIKDEEFDIVTKKYAAETITFLKLIQQIQVKTLCMDLNLLLEYENNYYKDYTMFHSLAQAIRSNPYITWLVLDCNVLDNGEDISLIKTIKEFLHVRVLEIVIEDEFFKKINKEIQAISSDFRGEKIILNQQTIFSSKMI